MECSDKSKALEGSEILEATEEIGDIHMKYVIVDFEMNPIAEAYRTAGQASRMEIIEIGAVIMDESLTVIGEFKTLVKPQFNHEIFKRYETLTGISTEMVAKAPEFAAAYEMFADWCASYGDEVEIYAWSDTDHYQLVSEMKMKDYNNREKKKLLDHWYDFQKEYTQKLGLERIISLEKALDYAGINFKGRIHDALCDARNTAELFAIIRDEEKCEQALKSVMEALKPKNINGTLGEMFDFSIFLSQEE